MAKPSQSEIDKYSGVWRCSCCGELKDCDPSWRWNGSSWEHKCPGNHPQHGHEPARYFGVTE